MAEPDQVRNSNTKSRQDHGTDVVKDTLKDMGARLWHVTTLGPVLALLPLWLLMPG